MPAYRAFSELRERMLPYLAVEARRSVDHHIPLMRALCFDWPDDPRIWEFPCQYMLGDSLLVAPVVEPGLAESPVYLPPGSWTDLWDGERLTGGAIVLRPVPLDRIPVFCRGTDPSLDGLIEVARVLGRGAAIQATASSGGCVAGEE